MGPLLLGEQPSPVAGPDGWTRPLSGRIATTLCSLAGLSPATYETLRASFGCRNVVSRPRDLPGGWWSSLEARTLFEQVWSSTYNPCVICLGRKVAAAGGIDDLDWGEWRHLAHVWGSQRAVTVIPHPSGLNRLYNETEYRELASRVLRNSLKLSWSGV